VNERYKMMMIVVVMRMLVMMKMVVIVMKNFSYDDLVKLPYTKIIRKTRAKNKKLELENDSLLAKYDSPKG
jgi:predicted signal transduction protein with EAL and GGDEF domain